MTTAQISPTTCLVCHENALIGDRSTWTTCRPCEHRIRTHLNEVDQLWHQLPNHLERGRGPAGERVSGNTQEGGALPLDETVLNLMVGAQSVPDRLAPHLADVRIHQLLPFPPVLGSADHRAARIVELLRRHLDWAVTRYDLDPLARELQKLTDRMRGAVGGGGSSIKELGTPCAAVYDDAPCGGTLQYDRVTQAITCAACGHVLDHLAIVNAAA